MQMPILLFICLAVPGFSSREDICFVHYLSESAGCAVRGRSGVCPLFAYQVADVIHQHDVYNEQGNHPKGVQHRAAAEQVKEDIVRGTVTLHEEHIIGIQQKIGGIGEDAEGADNGKGDGDIALFHACHTDKDDVQGSETGGGMGDAGKHIGNRQHRVAGIVISGAVCAHHGPQQPENGHKIQRGFLDHAVAESGQGKGDELDAAQEQGQVVQPAQPAAAECTVNDDLDDFHRVHQDGSHDQHPVFLLNGFVFVTLGQQDGQPHHDHHQCGHKGQVLPGKIALRLTGIATDSEKFFQHENVPS